MGNQAAISKMVVYCRGAGLELVHAESAKGMDSRRDCMVFFVVEGHNGISSTIQKMASA